MNGHAKRTIDTLIALDFQLDEDHSTRNFRTYWHANDPTRLVKVFGSISEVAARKVRNLAGEIAGMSSAGERIPASVAANARIKRQEERAKRDAEAARLNREREEYQRRADADAARRAEAYAEAERLAHRRSIASLMQPGLGR